MARTGALEWEVPQGRCGGVTGAGPQRHLPGGSLLAGDLFLPSRDQVIEGDAGDAGSVMRAERKVSGLG